MLGTTKETINAKLTESGHSPTRKHAFPTPEYVCVGGWLWRPVPFIPLLPLRLISLFQSLLHPWLSYMVSISFDLPYADRVYCDLLPFIPSSFPLITYLSYLFCFIS